MRLREYCESSHVATGFCFMFISLVRRGIDFRLNTCRRAVLRRNDFTMSSAVSPFRGSSIVSHVNLVELGVVEGEKNLFRRYQIGNEVPGRFGGPPSQFLNQRWTP